MHRLDRIDAWFFSLVQRGSMGVERLTGRGPFAQARPLIAAWVILNTIHTFVVGKDLGTLGLIDKLLSPLFCLLFGHDYLRTYEAERAALCPTPAKHTFWITWSPRARGALSLLVTLALAGRLIPPFDLKWLVENNMWIWPVAAYLLDMPPRPPMRSAMARAWDRLRARLGHRQPAGATS